MRPLAVRADKTPEVGARKVGYLLGKVEKIKVT
jgi:hypothetical protein